MNRRSVLVTWMFSYASLLILLIALYLAQSATAKAKLTQEYREIASTLQKQTGTILDTQLRQIKQNAISLCMDDTISAYAANSVPDGPNYYTLIPIQKKIASQCASSPYVDEIYLYFSHLNKVLSSQTICAWEKFAEKEMPAPAREQFSNVVRQRGFNEFVRMDGGVWLTTSFSLVSQSPRATLIQTLDLSALRALMTERVAIENSTLLLVDAEGELICAAGDANCAQEILDAWLRGEKRLVAGGETYWHIEETLAEVPWTLLTVQPMSSISIRANWIWRQALPMLLIVLAIGLMMTCFFLRANYRPLKALHERAGVSSGNEYEQIGHKLTSLESEMAAMQRLQQEQMERAAEEFFASCLRNPSILFDEGVRDMLARIGVADWGDFYAVFLFPEEAADEILELAQTILPQYGAKVIHAAYGGVVMMTVGVSNERVALSALEALEKALVSLPYSHSAVHHDEKGEMYLAIQEARSAMMPASRDIFAFSYAQEKMLSRYILAGNAEAAQALLAAVYKENISEKKLSRAMRRYLTFDVLAAMVKVVADVPQKGRAEADQLFEKMEKKFYSDWNDDAHYELFAALAGDLAHLCARTYSLLETRALSLEEVFACVERHFTECDFNVSRAAELLDVSVAYLSKSFKELSGINLLAYISGVRITYAKELMSRERISVMEAARRAGFENPNTFIRAFKKYEGMTPGNYIKQQE